MLLLTGLNMRCSRIMLTHFTLATIFLQDMIVTSCPIFKRLENIRIENEPFRTWTTDDETSSTENCASLCYTSPVCLSFLVEGTMCTIYNTTLWTPEGVGLISHPGSGMLHYRVDLYREADLEWFPIYKISRGAGSGFYDLWIGNGSTSNVTSCHMTPEAPCDTHYKHPIVEFRDQLRLNQMKVAVYRRGEELFNLTFEGSAMDKLNFWNRRNLLDFTAPDQWTNISSHLDLNVTAGAGFYFVGGKSPLDGAAVANLFGVWDRVAEYRYNCANYAPTPQILFSSHGSIVSLRQAGFVFSDNGGARYSQTFQSAREPCESFGARLATYNELDTARNDGGMSCCNCGFVQAFCQQVDLPNSFDSLDLLLNNYRPPPTKLREDGSQWYPMTYAHPYCRDSAGMHRCDRSTANAYCTFDGDSVEAADTFVIFLKPN